jgi:hypothetical protein
MLQDVDGRDEPGHDDGGRSAGHDVWQTLKELD